MADEKKPAPSFLGKRDDDKSDSPAPARAVGAEPEIPSNENIPGGKYLVDDVLVNAAGIPIDEEGKVKKDKG